MVTLSHLFWLFFDLQGNLEGAAFFLCIDHGLVFLLIFFVGARGARRTDFNVVFGLADLWQVVILRERPVLPDKLERANQIVVALNQLLDLRRVILVSTTFAFIWFAHRQAPDQLELVPDEVRIVDYGCARLLSHLDELCQNVVSFGAVTWQLVVGVPLKDVGPGPQ